MTHEQFMLAKSAIEVGCSTLVFITAAISFTVLRMKSGRQKASIANTTQLEQDVAALKQQLAELRDTATHYDMSFDTALQRIDRRLDHLEGATREDSASLPSGKLVIRT